jgi:hypothetical protein
VTGGELGFIDECVFGDIEPCGCQSASVGIDIGICEDILRLIGEGFGMKTFRPILRNKA